MQISLKALSAHAREASAGKISLANEEGPLFKKALLCRTGTFNGIYGEVAVTRQMLENIANRYNRERANPQNENDYSPILTDHVREVDRIKGRIIPLLFTEPWIDPATGNEETGLFGSLRIDTDREKVINGLYAQLSITFCEETFELYEVSFVAVEAARRSIILSQGDKTVKHITLEAFKKRQTALSSTFKTHRETRKVSLAALAKAHADLGTEVTSLAAKAQNLVVSFKSQQVQAKMLGFVKQGKLTPAEMKKIDCTQLAALDAKALEYVIGAYESRAVSTDLLQFGQVGNESAPSNKMPTPEEMRELIELQRSGKDVTSLAAGDGGGDADDEEDDDGGEGEDAGDSSASFDMDGFAKCLEEISGFHTKLSELVEKCKGLGKDTAAMSDDEKKREEKEDAELAEEPEAKEGAQPKGKEGAQ